MLPLPDATLAQMLAQPAAVHEPEHLMPAGRSKYNRQAPPVAMRDCGPEPTHAGIYDHPGSRYTDAELEFLKAMAAFKKQKKRPFPSCVDHFRVMLNLGYQKGGPTRRRKKAAAAAD